jgi:hypothetical protein
MSSAPERQSVLAPQEWLFLGLVVLFWSGFVVALGKDTSWDFRNYHWYVPYALLNGRMGFDVAVAHQATYYNPLLDVPFYWLANHTHSWFALGVMGAVQGSNVIPLYLIARKALRVAETKLAAGALALLGATGALTVSLYGTTYYDNIMSVFLLTSIAILVLNGEELAYGPLFTTGVTVAIAGFLSGCAVGLKLPEAPFAIGFAAALLALGGDLRHQLVRLALGGLGGAAGFVLCASWWMLKMEHLTGNPLFPYFNEYFHSHLALSAPYRDMRFIPVHFWRTVLFPLLFSFDWHVADDLGFQDIRVGVAYLLSLAAGLIAILGQRAKDPLMDQRATAPVFAFAAVSYVVWLKLFAIYRYILCLEMLAPILIVTAIGLMPLERRTRLAGIVCIFFAILLVTRSEFIERAPLADPYVQVALPPIANPDKAMIVMTGDGPLGFLAPAIPHQIPLLRIDGWMVQPNDGTRMTREMRARVSDHLKKKGPLYLIADAYDMTRASEALTDYGLGIVWTECRLFDTNLAGTYQFCPVVPRH